MSIVRIPFAAVPQLAPLPFVPRPCRPRAVRGASRFLVVACLTSVFHAQDVPAPPKPRLPIEPTYSDLSYGPHPRNVMDVWLAKSDQPTPVLVSIHGGAFQAGDKTVGPGLLKLCLDARISVVAITYRMSRDAMAPAQFLDGARAVQFIRHNAKVWNIDPRRVAASGASAGGGISLWLAFHDDLADPKNDDPVLRESTRLTCVSGLVVQTSYDPRFVKTLIPENDTYKSQFFGPLFGVNPKDLDHLPPEKYRLFEEVSPINHVTRDDPPVLLIYGSGLDAPVTDLSVGIHHPRFGKALKDKLDALGVPCELVLTNTGNESKVFEFVRRQFGMK